MSELRINSINNRLSVDSRRARQTPRDNLSFERVLRGGAQMLLAGAATATRLAGLPTLSAAISTVDVGGPSAGEGNATSSMSNSTFDIQQGLQQQRLDDDLELLALQEGIQRHNRQIALVSNMLKARHDTAKAAIGNMRA